MNNRLLARKFRVRRIASEGPMPAVDGPAIFVANHVSYIDPHALFHLMAKAGQKRVWLAGIEPFEKGGGIDAWHICHCGAMSIDRGVLDKQALKQVQAVLKEGTFPLVIFPEGEADYTRRVVRPFYDGAAAMAMKHWKRTGQDVQVIPLYLDYTLTEDVSAQLYRDWLSFRHELGLSGKAPDALSHLVTETIDAAIDMLMAEYGLETRQASSLDRQGRIEALIRLLVQQLSKEHQLSPGGSEALSATAYHPLLDFKNRYRSHVVRKCRVAQPGDLEKVYAYTQHLQQTSGDALSWLHRLALKALETAFIGDANRGKDEKQRVRDLCRSLKEQLRYAQENEGSNPEKRERWDRQLLDCRRIKLLRLLWDDVARLPDTDSEHLSIDEAVELLFKLELLMKHRFVYRYPRGICVRQGTPLRIQDLAARYGDDVEALGAISDHLRDLVQGLAPLDDVPLDPPVLVSGEA